MNLVNYSESSEDSDILFSIRFVKDYDASDRGESGDYACIMDFSMLCFSFIVVFLYVRLPRALSCEDTLEGFSGV